MRVLVQVFTFINKLSSLPSYRDYTVLSYWNYLCDIMKNWRRRNRILWTIPTMTIEVMTIKKQRKGRKVSKVACIGYIAARRCCAHVRLRVTLLNLWYKAQNRNPEWQANFFVEAEVIYWSQNPNPMFGDGNPTFGGGGPEGWQPCVICCTSEEVNKHERPKIQHPLTG